MVAAPPQMGHRTDGYDDDRRRPGHELHRRDDLGEERRDDDVREDRKLTLVTLVQVVRPERDGDGGDLRWTATAVPERKEMTATIHGLRARLTGGGGRGEHGGDDGATRSVPCGRS